MGISDNIKQKQDKAAMLSRSLELQVKMYPEKTHFIYELLQNAEDAGARVVNFVQYADRLEMYHDGKPFTESNVQSLCDAANSDKSGKIGKFGIGFKSVFTICRIVELYSEPNNRPIENSLPHFAIRIENYTDPSDINDEWMLEKPYTTKFIFYYVWENYYKSIEELRKDVATKLHRLGISVLLFLSNIKEIQYNISGVDKGMDSNGLYMLDKVELTADDPSTKTKYYKVTAVGNRDELDVSYLLFSRPLENINRTVDIAFAMTEENSKFSFRRITSNYVSVYFPTQMESKLNFLIQAPFDVIPTRNSLEENSDNNTEYITVLSELLRDSVIEISKNKWLSLDFLNLLPFSMPDEDFPFKRLYVGLYNKTLELFKNEKILPVIDNDNICISKENAKLARGGVREGGIVEMFPNDKLALLVGVDSKWMPTKTNNDNFTDGDDNLGKLYNFLKKKIGVAEIGNEEIPVLLRDNPNFIKAFADNEEWLKDFYNYLVQKCRADLGKKQKYAQIPFIKTTKGDFKSAHKIIGQEQSSNIYRKPKNALRELESLNFTAEFIQEKCTEFLELMNIPEPDEYDHFKKELEDIYNDEKIDEKQNIEQFKKSIKFLKDNKENIKGLLKTYLLLKCTKANGEELWTTCNSAIFFSTDINKISLFNYFIETEIDVYILDDNYYIKNGANIESLRLLKEVGVRDSGSIIVKGCDLWNENGLSSGNRGNFKRYLDFNYISNVLLYIHENQNLETAKNKSKSLFLLLKTVENNLKGEWRHGAQSPVYKNDVAEIVKKLNGSSYLYVNNTLIYTKGLKWLYSNEGKFVLPSEITRFELDLSLYGEIDNNSEIYDILNFRKTEQDKNKELVSNFFAQHSEQEIETLLKLITREEEDEFDPTVPSNEPFPSEPVKDNNHLDGIQKNIQKIFNGAEKVKYERLLRRIRTSRGKDKEHIGLRYRGHCQMCEVISPYWEITEILPEPDKEIEQMNLSFCPTCAAKYRRLRNDDNAMSAFQEEILNADINAELIVNISDEKIHFTAIHLAEIQKLLLLKQSDINTAEVI